MKKIVLSLAMVVGLALSMAAQQPQGMNRPQGPRSHNGEARIERMAQELNLTPEQREKVSKIFQDEAKQMQKDREKMMDQRKKTDEKVMKVLNDEQRAKYGKMLEQRGNRHFGAKPDGKMGPRPDGKMGHRPDGKMGPRHHGKKEHRHDGKMCPRPDGSQPMTQPQAGTEKQLAD